MVHRSSRLALCAVAAGLLTAVAGCQTYERRPLDAMSHHEAFLSRSPASAEVAEFAARLEQVQPHADRFDPSDGLTAPEAELVALVFNADLRLARLRAGVTRARAENAGLWEDPMLNVNIGRMIDAMSHPWMVMSMVGVTLPLSGRLEVEKKRAGAEHAASLARIYQSEWRTRVDLRSAWLEWTAAAERKAVLEDVVGRLDSIVAIVAAIEGAGELARLESTLFRVEHASRLAELEGATADLFEREQAVRQLMGLAPNAPVQLAPSLRAPQMTSSDDVLAALRRSPELAVAAAEYEIAERDLELEIRRQYPDLQVGPGFEREDGEDSVLIGLTLPIPVLNRNRAGIAAASAERELSRGAFESSLEQLQSQVAVAAERLEAAKRQRRILEEQVVPMVDQQYTDARRVAELGEVNVFVLLETLTRQQDAKLQLIGARLSEGLAAVRLQGLMGPEPEQAPNGAEKLP